MARYIDADAVDFSPLKNDFDRARAKVVIMGQPTADVVEVVRCKDCRHFDGEGCLKTHGEFEPNPTDYCSYGERRCEE